MNVPASHTLDTIMGSLAERGLAWRGAFHPEPDDKVPAFPNGAPALTVCLFGWTGGEQWPVFAGSPEANDGLPDPLNRWSKRTIDSIAGPLDAAALYPFGGPPWHDFQRWALKAEAIYRSPLGLLIHPKWGLWHSYRGAVALRRRFELPRSESAAHPHEDGSNPCDQCLEWPCLSACPVSAFAPGSPYNYAACRQHLQGAGEDCRTTACAARRACPIGTHRRYSEPQATFHMRALLANRFG